MPNYVKTRDSARNSIKRYLGASKNETNFSTDRELVQSYLQLLNEQWLRFNEAQDEVEVSCGQANQDAEEQERVQTETWYMEALANLNRFAKSFAQTTTNAEAHTPVSQASASIQLPKIQLPIFEGEPTEWISFHDAFVSLVDGNNSLSGVQKMHYLRCSLRGEALQVINSFKVSDVNYAEAWKLIKLRYKSVRVIVEHHFRSIFAICSATCDSANDIKCVLDTTLQHVRALEALGRPVDFWDDWLVHVVISKLAFETRKQWELSLTDDGLPTFEQLQTFLETRCRSLGMLSSITPTQSSSKSTSRKFPKSSNVLHASNVYNNTRDQEKCLFCDNKHKIYACNSFIKLDANAKVKFIKQNNACLNCLSKIHSAEKCRSGSTCQICRMRHHTTLHNAFSNSLSNTHASNASLESLPNNSNSASSASSNDMNSTLSTQRTSQTSSVPSCFASPASTAANKNAISSQNYTAEGAILLATALASVKDAAGRWQPVRILFDNGSHATFVTESCIQRLCLPRSSSLMHISGIGSQTGLKTRGEVTLNISSRNAELSNTINAQILSKITNDLPTAKLQKFAWPHIQDLPLADPHFDAPGPIEILLGMDEMEKFVLANIRKGMPGTPIAQETTLGWVLFGRAGHISKSFGAQVLHCDSKLVTLVSKFWELEELPPRKHLTAEESYCEDLFNKTHQRAPDGRFIVRLPMKANVNLGETRSAAVRSLLRMEKRLAADDDLRSQYNNFMKELIDLHHMELVTNVPERCLYMPHHAVVKDTSTTTKLRVVFNASAKSSTGNSLNDALLVGPQLQRDLFSVLIRFRSHRYAMTADVQKMYRQVYVASDQVDYQRIVWRANPTEPVQDYRMLRVTYGVAAASHLAVKSLQQTAFTNDESFKNASSAILQDFYMDDLLSGASTKSSLSDLQSKITTLLSSGGFELRKWATNCKQLYDSLPHRSRNISQFLAADEEVRALGLLWNTEYDYLTFTVCIEPLVLTKRAFLSEASKLFDPLGFIAPCTIKSKIWFQQIWRTNVDWDEAVPHNIASEWLAHREDLKSLSSLRLNRWLGTGQKCSQTEYHVFADASESAFAAVIYARTFDAAGNAKVAFVTAKTKVAPLKTTSLPRLELCAAHLAAKLVRSVVASLDSTPVQFRAWSDSTVTLAWLQSHPSRWSTFVANRVADIQEVLPAECWCHVRSESNPADCASRGMSPTQLLQHQLWWQGPQWLRDASKGFKQNNSIEHDTDLELSSKNVKVLVTSSEECWELLERYSSYGKLKRVTAYMLRFINNTRAKLSKTTTKVAPLNFHELCAAENALVKYMQTFAFSNEISLCRQGKPLSLRSSLLRLQPFLDEHQLLRVGGRISRSNMSIDRKHPLLLPKNSPLARLIIADIHRFTLHAGPQTMQSVLQRRFWVLGSRNLVRKMYRSCVKCKLLNRTPCQQNMADLPLNRTVYARCFLRSAVDFAGPFAFKFSPGRGSKSMKGYICSFICMSTGAMHLEFVSGLSTNAFLNAFKRFVNRRGYCHHMHSDNGTNFVGADKELRHTLQQCLADPTTHEYFNESSITWHFNPPNAPHMGGYWEVGIKRVKYHLKRALGEVLLTFEEFTTLLTEIEACVNSRPLCTDVAANADDFEILTPGHFIMGEPLKSLPEVGIQEFNGNLHLRWQTISAIRQHFWRRWRDEYLVSLQKRTKWFRETPNICEDDVVAIIEDNTPPTKWKLARVLKCHPGSDGRVRVVTLKTAEGERLRPITKLCRLPTNQDISN